MTPGIFRILASNFTQAIAAHYSVREMKIWMLANVQVDKLIQDTLLLAIS
jgi:hypothetical protein